MVNHVDTYHTLCWKFSITKWWMELYFWKTGNSLSCINMCVCVSSHKLFLIKRSLKYCGSRKFQIVVMLFSITLCLCNTMSCHPESFGIQLSCKQPLEYPTWIINLWSLCSHFSCDGIVILVVLLVQIANSESCLSPSIFPRVGESTGTDVVCVYWYR